MKKRVLPFGMGKVIIRINLNELPEDIREGIIEVYSQNENKFGDELTNAETIGMVCDVFTFKEKRSADKTDR